MLKIDTHAHILPPSWPNLAEKFGDDRFPVMVEADGRHRIYKDGRFFREVWANAFDAEVRIGEYARFGVDVQVVSTVPVLFSYWAKPSQALELHRHLNDHTAGLCRQYPRHYAGIGTVPLQAPTLAIQEMERCIDELGLSGRAGRIALRARGTSMRPSCFRSSKPRPNSAPRFSCIPGT